MICHAVNVDKKAFLVLFISSFFSPLIEKEKNYVAFFVFSVNNVSYFQRQLHCNTPFFFFVFFFPLFFLFVFRLKKKSRDDEGVCVNAHVV